MMADGELGDTSTDDGDRRASGGAGNRQTGESLGGEHTDVDRLRASVRRIRTQPRAHRIALAVAVVVGLGLAWLHWLGLLLGGMLLGVVARTVRGALLAGLGFGLIVLTVFAVTIGGSLGQALAMTPPIYLTIGAALGLPTFGALVRGLG